MMAMLLGIFLPQDELRFAEDENWRIIYAMPGVFAIVQLTLFLFIFREEPINYCIGNERDEEALRLIRRVYSPRHPSETGVKGSKVVEDLY
jgi:ABC-type sulfate transport system permease subunit